MRDGGYGFEAATGRFGIDRSEKEGAKEGAYVGAPVAASTIDETND